MYFEEYTIEEVQEEKDINYLVKNKDGPGFRLISWQDGFEVAEEDTSCGPPPDEISRISDFILSYDA